MRSLELESSLLAALGNLVLGLAIFLRRPASRVHQAFGLLSLAIALWNVGDFGYLLSLERDPAAPSLGWSRLTFAGSMAIPPAAFILVRGLTRRGRDWTWSYGWALLAQFAVVVALLWSPLFPDTYRLVAAAYQFPNLGLSLALLLIRMRPAGPEERLQIKYVFAGGLLATASGVTDYLAAGGVAPIPRLGAPAILLYLCLVAAAIGRHGLFSASKVFGRWVLVLVVAFLLAAFLQTAQRFQPPGLLAECLTPLLVAVLAVALYDPLRGWLRAYESAERKKSEELAERITSVGRRLAFTPEPDRWQEVLVGGLRDLPGMRAVSYLARPAGGGPPTFPAQGLRAEILDGLYEGPSPESGPWKELLGGGEKSGPGGGARDGRWNLVVPVQDRERLYGVVALQLHKPRLHLEPEHLDLLTLLGTQAGLVCQDAERLRWMKRREEQAALAELAAGAAHEIKNPLGAIRGAVDLLSEDPGDRAGKFLGIIREEVDRLDRFLGDFLAYGKPGVLDVSRLDLAALAREAVERLALRPEAPPAAVTGDSEVRIRGDASRLRQVLLNLLLNAAQAAGPSGRIEVRVEGTAAGAAVKVRDTGPGVSPEILPRLFRPFFTTRQGGTGLGLAICARIADLHGGSISAGSWKDGEAGGAEFVLRIPENPPGRSDPQGS